MLTTSMHSVLTWLLILAAPVFGEDVDGDAISNTRECIKNTGQTCTLGACYGWLGDTVCDRSAFGFGGCFCASGCVGEDEVCHANKTNTPPGGDAATPLNDQPVYKLRNARWPDWYVYVSGHSQGGLWVSKQTDSKSEFTILVPPRQSTNLTTSSIYLLYSKEWPDSPVFFSCGVDVSTYQRRCAAVSQRMTSAKTLTDLGVHLEIAPVENPNPGRTLLIISSSKYTQQISLCVPGGMLSPTQVSGCQSDPGASGYWYFEPELPKDILERIPRHTGSGCSGWDCGHVAVLSTPAPESNSTNMFLSAAVNHRISSGMSLIVSAAMFFSVLMGDL